MQHILTLSRTAVVVRHWFEIDLEDASMEHGARIELRELTAGTIRPGGIIINMARPAMLDAADLAWRQPSAIGSMAAVVPIWRRPWMVLGRDTFAGDLLARLGVSNLYGSHQDRYPRVDIAELRGADADLVVLPDEPYRFTASDGPEAFPGRRTALVSGRHLTWYGPSLTEAPAVLRRQLGAARVR